LPEFDNYESFVYNAIDRRDPFMAYVEPTPVASGGKKNTLRPPENHVPEALEAFPLDGLEFVGLMENKRETWALIKAPDNIIHRVKVGNRLGQNYGKVTAVAEAKVDLVEIVEDGLGGWMKRDAAIALSE
jgi:type IV pilus assembly protein PilP